MVGHYVFRPAVTLLVACLVRAFGRRRRTRGRALCLRSWRRSTCGRVAHSAGGGGRGEGAGGPPPHLRVWRGRPRGSGPDLQVVAAGRRVGQPHWGEQRWRKLFARRGWPYEGRGRGYAVVSEGRRKGKRQGKLCVRAKLPSGLYRIGGSHHGDRLCRGSG